MGVFLLVKQWKVDIKNVSMGSWLIKYGLTFSVDLLCLSLRIFQCLREESRIEKSKITKISNSNGKSVINVYNIKRMVNNCHISDVLQAFHNVENSGSNQVFLLD